MLPTCSICGTAPDDWMTEGWTVTKDDTEDAPATTYICAECARKHIRSIEGKLADEDWAW